VIRMEYLVKYVGGCTRDVVSVNVCATRELTPTQIRAAAPSVSFKHSHLHIYINVLTCVCSYNYDMHLNASSNCLI